VSAECFVVGPIGDRLAPLGSEGRERYEEAVEVYENVILAACAVVGITATRADSISEPGEVTESICLRLRDSPIVVADVTNGNPNVMYELGLRHATGKPTVQIGEYGRLPFDISAIRTVRFVRSPAGLVDGRKRLEEALRSALDGEGTPVTASRVFRPQAPGLDGKEALPEPQVEEPVEDPGLVDLMVEMESALPHLNETVVRMTHDMEALGTVTNAATTRVEAAVKDSGAKGVQTEAARLAAELGPVADRMEAEAAEYEAHLRQIDTAVRAVIEAIKDGRIEGGQFPRQIGDMAKAARDSMRSAANLADSVGKNESLSKTLRVPLRRIRLALGRVVAASEVIQTWEAALS
jgi:hypothetical protein